MILPLATANHVPVHYCKVVGGALALRTRRRPGDDFFLVPGAKRNSGKEYPFVSCWYGPRVQVLATSPTA